MNNPILTIYLVLTILASTATVLSMLLWRFGKTRKGQPQDLTYYWQVNATFLLVSFIPFLQLLMIYAALSDIPKFMRNRNQ